ncbi:MAG: hypothetical protein HQL73_06230, partial [Magnetococcales bacterium]|nr:hypothetical protein [Magnetococcales bacterium]
MTIINSFPASKFLLLIAIEIFFCSKVVEANNKLIILDKTRPIVISYSKCGTDRAKQMVKMDKNLGTVNWKWESKTGIWCGWGTPSLPTPDLSPYLSGFLVIRFTGSYQGPPPEVKFIDTSDNHTQLVNFMPYINGLPTTGAEIKIPMKNFGFDPKFGANPVTVKHLQLDAEYTSD